MENKYKIEFTYLDGEKQSFIGRGTPKSTLTEYLVVSPDGSEIVVLKSNVRAFQVSKYEE